MMTYKEINEFLTSFNTDSYNRSQIGNDKQLMIHLFEFLSKLNISSKEVDLIISNIAFLNKSDINMPLYLDLLSKSLGFLSTYKLKDIITSTLEVHNVYKTNCNEVSLEDYLHDTKDVRNKRIYLDRNNKYVDKDFTSPESLNHIGAIKLAAAIVLSNKEYNEFMMYITDFKKYQDSYSPVILFKTYSKIRKHLDDESLIFWDILFGNEYLIALTKNNINIDEIYKRNVFDSTKKRSIKKQIPVQLDLFSLEEDDDEVPVNINEFQICTIFNSNEQPEFNKEKDLLMYYDNLLNSRDAIILPKLKEKHNTNYLYEIN